MKIRVFCFMLIFIAILEVVVALFICNKPFYIVLDIIVCINCVKYIQAIPLGYTMEKIDYAELSLLVILLLFVGFSLYEVI